MSEPLYTYVKGKGWIIQNYPTVTFRDGVYQLLPRNPELGELFSYVRKDNRDGFVNPDGTLNLESIARHYELYKSENAAQLLNTLNIVLMLGSNYVLKPAHNLYVTFEKIT